MKKTITVRGTGRAFAKPDHVVLSMSLEARDIAYEKAMETAEKNIGELNVALEEAGFAKDSAKTANFTVRADYDNVSEKDGGYRRVFSGYAVNHELKVEFDLEAERLTRALAAVGACLAHPQLSIRFTVKDASAMDEALLRSATADARRKAELLTDASGTKLGKLISIDCGDGAHNAFSSTRYDVDEECLRTPMLLKAASIEIEPDDIKASDGATFVWEISD